MGCGTPHIRVVNRGSEQLDQIVVFFPSGRTDFGSLQAGEASEYVAVSGAYRYASIELFANGDKLNWTPRDYVGERPLWGGYYSYVLSLEETARGQALILALETSYVEED